MHFHNFAPKLYGGYYMTRTIPAKTRSLTWAGYFLVALMCQLLFGDCPKTFFAFPVNAAFVLLGGGGLWVAWRERSHSFLMRLLSSVHSTFLLLGVLAATCIVMGFTSWPAPSSWWMFFVMTALMAHLFIVLFAGLGGTRRHKVRFALIHAGLLLALVGGFAGSADAQVWRLVAHSGQTTNKAFDINGRLIDIGHAIRLEQFLVDRYPDGTPRHFEAKLDIDGQGATVRVNHPLRLTWSADLYLADYEPTPTGIAPRYCILQIVNEPWKLATGAGIWMLIAGCALLFAQSIPAHNRKGGNDR